MVKQKNKSKKRQMTVSRRPSSAQAQTLAKKVCALTDPFCHASHGMRWTDDGDSATITYQRREVVTVTTGATYAWAYLQFFPGNGGDLDTYTSAAATGNAATIAANASGTFTVTDSETVRVVSAGARWFDVAPATSAGGHVIASECQSYNHVAGKTVTSGDANFTNKVKVYDRRQPVTWISKPTATNAYGWYQPSATPTQDVTNRRSGLILAVTGAAGTAVLEVELVVNYEFTINADTLLARIAGASPSNPSTRFAAKVAYEMESSMDTFVARSSDAAIQHLENVALHYVKKGLAATAGYLLGGPAGATAGLIMDVD